MNHYRAIDAAYNALARRRPPWIATLAPTTDTADWVGRPAREQLDRIVAVVNGDPRNTPASDDMLRRLAAIGRTDSDAITVILRAFIPRLRARIHRTANAEYHGDAIAALAMVCLDSDLTGTGLAMRMLNRAHNRTLRQGRRVRTRGQFNVFTTNPVEPDVLREIGDRGSRFTGDHADHVTQIVDLARFSEAARDAVLAGDISERTWEDFRDIKLARALLGGPALSATSRTKAHRAGKRMEVLIDSLLCSHAA